MHDHTYYELHIQTRGSVRHCLLEGSSEILRAGDVLILAPHLCHCYQSTEEENEYINFPVQSKIFLAAAEYLNVPSVSVFLSKKMRYLKTHVSPEKLVEINHTVSKIALGKFPPAEECTRYKFLLVDLLRCFLEPVKQEELSYPNWLINFLMRVHNPDIYLKPLEEISALSGYSHSHFCKIFKEQTGHTLQEYIIALKMQYAARLLEETDYSLSYIATEVGYATQGHFTKVFQRNFFISPLAYRKKSQMNP